MKLIFIQILVALSAVFSSCNANKTASSSESVAENSLETVINNPYEDQTSEFKGVTIESQSTNAGVYSNLKGTRKYEVKMSAEVSEDITFKRLLVDSVAIPFSSLIVSGDKIKGQTLSTSSDLVRLTAFRNIYNYGADAPQVHEVKVYEPSGLSLGKKAVIEYYKGDKPYYIEIPEITILPAIYAP